MPHIIFPQVAKSCLALSTFGDILFACTLHLHDTMFSGCHIVILQL